jgi:hypothetical protein
MMMMDDSVHTEIVSVHKLWAVPNNMDVELETYLESALTIASNMLAIGTHLSDIEKASPELSTYLTCCLLLNLLGFVHDGLEVWSTEILKGLGHEVGKEKLRKYLKELKKILLDIDPSLSLRRPSWKLRGVSAIWLLIEVVYKTMESPPITIGENQRSHNKVGLWNANFFFLSFWLDDCESQLLRPLNLVLTKPEDRGTGLPEVIFICTSHPRDKGIILGECKTRWWPFTAVDKKFAQMRLNRFPADGLETLKRNYKILHSNWRKSKDDLKAFSQLPEMADFQRFSHRAEQGRAYRIYSEDKKNPFTQCAPCAKCFHTYDWGDQDKLQPEEYFHRAGNCAEDDVHLRLGNGYQRLLNIEKNQSSY